MSQNASKDSVRGLRVSRAFFAFGLVLALAAGQGRAVGQIVFNNLDQPPPDPPLLGYTAGDQVGNAVLVLSNPIVLTNVILSESVFGPAPGEFFTINSRNPDGTVGSVIKSDFTSSYDPGTGLDTFTPITPFLFFPNTGYFLVLNSAVPGDINAAPAWDYTLSTSFTSNGITLPTTNTSFYNFGGSGNQYFDLEDGPQKFQINGTLLAAVPEPGQMTLAAVAGVFGMGATYFRRRARKS